MRRGVSRACVRVRVRVRVKVRVRVRVKVRVRVRVRVRVSCREPVFWQTLALRGDFDIATKGKG
jgi:hypothetical protein